jgi:hypothetical protein
MVGCVHDHRIPILLDVGMHVFNLGLPSRMQGPSTGSPAFTLTMESMKRTIMTASCKENMPRFGQKRPERRTASRLWCHAYFFRRGTLY